MKSFCIKTNNSSILNYILNRIEKIDFEDLIYSKNIFKIYQNVIIHYHGKNNQKFFEFLSELITEVILEFYEEKLIKQILDYNYFYFDDYERVRICENCIELIENSYSEKLQEKSREEIMQNAVFQYVKENKSMILNGFIHFRLKNYMKYLDNIIDTAVNQFIIEKEYNEFINLLKIYVESRVTECELLHLIYINGESFLLDKEKNIVSVSENICNAKYLSDISFSSNDFALNTLLTLLPAKIEIHLIGEEDEFINTIKLIFDNKVSICRECNICETYKMLQLSNIK